MRQCIVQRGFRDHCDSGKGRYEASECSLAGRLSYFLAAAGMGQLEQQQLMQHVSSVCGTPGVSSVVKRLEAATASISTEAQQQKQGPQQRSGAHRQGHSQGCRLKQDCVLLLMQACDSS
jgi:hypothetical protein